MQVQSLRLNDLRNIERAELKLHPSLNLIYGANGAGKTSILEGIHLLSDGRTFRHASIQPLIRKGAGRAVAFGEILDPLENRVRTIGVIKEPGGGSRFRVDRDRDVTAAELARILPVQVLAQQHADLLDGGPGARRKFVDWGLFHVEHEFFQEWKRFQRVLRQRNGLLRHGKIGDAEIRAWDEEFLVSAKALDAYRAHYVERYSSHLQSYVRQLLGPDREIRLQHYPGWDSRKELGDLLKEGLSRDREAGYSRIGPHRADLRVAGPLGGVANTFSRGQRKLLNSALRLAQGTCLRELTGKRCLYLVDELHAELDTANARKLGACLTDSGHQVLVTSAVDADADPCWPGLEEKAVFHVEHGRVHARE